MFGRHHHHQSHRHCGRRGGHGPDFVMGWGQGARGWSEDRPHGRRRMFDGGELRLILLKLIEESPRHGYDLIREIEERSGGAYAPSPGVVYPTLTMLDDMGLIEEQKTEGSRRAFAITEAGRTHLAERGEEVAALFARLADLGTERARTSGGPVRRAMRNLKTALVERLSTDEVDADTLHRVAAIIDEAVQKIERLK